MSVGFSGDRIESESDSVPETTGGEVVTLVPRRFYKKEQEGKVDGDVSVRN